MSSGEPAAKKAKTDDKSNGDDEPTGWEGHTLNISEAVMKADEGRFITEIADAEVSILQGIGPYSEKVLKGLGVKTVAELAKYKFFLMARSLATMAETEVKGDRPKGSKMNVDKAVDKEWENKTLQEICAAPTEALEGISQEACELLESLGVKSIGDLATFKYCRWAEAMVTLKKYEETRTAKQRKVDAALKKLS